MAKIVAVAVLLAGVAFTDYGAALSRVHQSLVLAEAESNGPSAGGRDNAQLADAESSGASPHGRDSAVS